MKNPTNYSRVETEARKAVTKSTEKTTDCCEYTFDEWGDPLYPNYRDYYAEYCCENTVYTDKYVYEWIEYMKETGHYDYFFQNMAISSVLDYSKHPELTPGEHPFLSMNGMMYYIEDPYDIEVTGFYFENNKIYAFMFGGTYEEIEECQTYYTYYDMQNVEFTQEYIEQYINSLGEYGCSFGLDQGSRNTRYIDRYYVESISVNSRGETYFHTNLRKEIDGESLPVLYFVWKDESIIVHYIEYTTSYTGEWVKTTENYSDDSGLVGFSVQTIGSSVDAEDTYCIATQTLFNNDAKWEFLRKVYEECIVENNWETYEEDRDEDGEIDYKRTRYENKVKGYEIVSEDGTVLATIDAPLSDDKNPDVNLLLWGEDAFLALTTWKYMEEDDTEYLTTIYSIDKNKTRVTKVASAPVMRVSPTVANRNSTINVTLGGETAKNGGELIITDSNGRTIGRSRVEAGQTSVPVTTDRMGSGVYNITLTEKGQKVENARIIVK